MITFGAKYLSDVTIGKVTNKKDVVPYKAAIVELNPDSLKDILSLNIATSVLPKRKRFLHSIYSDFLSIGNKYCDNRLWTGYFALTKKQASYEFIRPANILGLAEVSSKGLKNDVIYLEYLQTLKNLFFNKTCFVGKSFLNFLKQAYPDKDIELFAVPPSVKFYLNNDFVISEKLKSNGLTKMRYFSKK